ncbi:MAG: HAMP domain-containing histidine kinase [Phaeodactylibacter sp.]|nr:HAMP domain-containing histidine kinase [Phaeodactylibacter sp.]MCB9301165.1 HAMP domain-containing histidine kinase [Lewinellaceae bacterium]
MKLRFRDRIALFNTLAAAVATLLVFLVVYGVVYYSAFHHLDQDILNEQEEVVANLHWKGDSLIINRMPEWDENEHKQVEVNPTFLQIVDQSGHLVFRSANLQSEHFLFHPSLEQPSFLNSQINGKRIRLGQFPIRNDSMQILGQLTIGVSQEESAIVLNNLRITLLIAFPLVLLVLYLATSLAAAKGIAPVQQLIRASTGIDDSNIERRLPLPGHKDEIYLLAKAINELLERIEAGINREKQFTADASHELRTPLSAIRGTLEVLIRRQREPGHYEEKIRQVILEVDRMNQLLNQLLQLARLETHTTPLQYETVYLAPLAGEVLNTWQQALAEKKMQFSLHIPEDAFVQADRGFLSIILDNLASNAIKYGQPGGKLAITWDPARQSLDVKDDGPGISPDQQPFLFDRFYRADASRNSNVQGTGLGLSIVKKLAALQHIRIEVISSDKDGATFRLYFSSPASLS